jgi:hypothetical protein
VFGFDKNMVAACTLGIVHEKGAPLSLMISSIDRFVKKPVYLRQASVCPTLAAYFSRDIYNC